MGVDGLIKSQTFNGTISAAGHQLPITFHLSIDKYGEMKFDFDQIARTDESVYIFEHCNEISNSFYHFTLTGEAGDGATFHTEHLYFTSPGNQWNEGEGHFFFRPSAHCSLAMCHRKLAKPVVAPQIRIHLRGFQCFDPLRETCELGTVVMVGLTDLDDPNQITGYLAIQPDEPPANLGTWHAAADKLLEHVRRVMSFAAGTNLRSPATDFYHGDLVETTLYQPTRQRKSDMPIIHYLNMSGIFRAAVRSYFNPPFEVKGLFFAIEWLSMDTTHSEVRLVNAMTALECLIDSNLTTGEKFFIRVKKFKKEKSPVMRQLILECLEDCLAGNNSEDFLNELDAKLTDFNRRTFKNKLKILTERWSVSLDGITEGMVKDVVTARNAVIHRGSYYKEGVEQQSLWKHVVVIREIAARFLMASIGYEGSYASHLGGWHLARFPPVPNRVTGDGEEELIPTAPDACH